MADEAVSEPASLSRHGQVEYFFFAIRFDGDDPVPEQVGFGPFFQVLAQPVGIRRNGVPAG